MRSQNLTTYTKGMLLAGILASNIAVSAVFTLAAQEKGEAGQPTATGSSSAPASSHRWHLSHSLFFERNWGISIFGVRAVSSGLMIEFRYRVLDAKKAKQLNDKKANPYLVDDATGARLIVPTMEKIGQLRQDAPPENGKAYWMVFSNPRRLVKPGSRVDVVIGGFRANGLVVE